MLEEIKEMIFKTSGEIPAYSMSELEGEFEAAKAELKNNGIEYPELGSHYYFAYRNVVYAWCIRSMDMTEEYDPKRASLYNHKLKSLKISLGQA